MKTPTQSFKDAFQRLVREMSNLRSEHAAIAAYGEVRPANSRFLFIAYTGLLNARQLRLVRLFEDSNKTASFWYLHRCALKLIEKNLDIARLRSSHEAKKNPQRLIRPSRQGGGFRPLGIPRSRHPTGRYSLRGRCLVADRARPVCRSVRGAALEVDPSLDELIRLLKESLSDLIEHG